MALARTVHIYITLFAFLGLLLFSVSGFMLHHDAWFSGHDFPDKPARDSSITLPKEWINVSDDKLNKLQIEERVRSEGHVTGAVEGDMEVDAEALKLEFRGPSRKTIAEIKRADGTTHIQYFNKGVAGILDDLHQGDHAGPVWDLVIDLVSITLCLASLTGLLIWTQLSKRRTIGLICLGLGSAIILGIYFAAVP